MGRSSGGDGILYLLLGIIIFVVLIIKAIIEFIVFIINIIIEFFQQNPYVLIILVIVIALILGYFSWKKLKEQRVIREEEIQHKIELLRIEEEKRKKRKLLSQNIPQVFYNVDEFHSDKFIRMRQVGIEGYILNSNTIPLTFSYDGTKNFSFGFEHTDNKNLIVFVSPKSHILLNTVVTISILFENERIIEFAFDKKPEYNTDRFGTKNNINSCEIFKEQIELFSQFSISKILIKNSFGQIISIFEFPLENQKWKKPCEIIKEMAIVFIKIVSREISPDAFNSLRKKGKQDKYFRERISQNIKDRVWNRDGGECVEYGSNTKLEFDHIIPVSKGGSSTYRNIQLLCETCNRKKSNKIG